jgi:hypothetical protein
MSHSSSITMTLPLKGKSRGKTSLKKRGKKFHALASFIKKVWSVLSGTMPSFTLRISENHEYPFDLDFESSSVIISSNATRTDFAINIELSALFNSSNFTAIFDQYKITEVEVFIYPTLTNSAAYVANSMSVVDYDDSNTLSSNSAYLNYENVEFSVVTNGHYRKFRPHIAIAAYQGAFTGFANEAPQWIDCAYPNIQHYGVKFGVEQDNVNRVFNLLIRARVLFRNVL